MVRKMELKVIEDELSRQLSFAKRRNGLIKKALELFILCGVDVAFIAFSPSGRLSYFSGDKREYEPSMELIKSPEEAEPLERGIHETSSREPLVDASHREDVTHPNQDSDPNKNLCSSTELARTPREATFDDDVQNPPPARSPSSQPAASPSSSHLIGATPPAAPFSPFPEALSPNLGTYQSPQPEHGSGFVHDDLFNASTPDDQSNMSDQAANDGAHWRPTHQEQPSENNREDDEPISNNFPTSCSPAAFLFQPLAGFGVLPQMQLPLFSPVPPQVPPKGGGTSALPPLMDSRFAAQQNIMQQPLAQPRYHANKHQDIINQAAATINGMFSAPSVLPRQSSVQAQQGMGSIVGTTLSLNIEGPFSHNNQRKCPEDDNTQTPSSQGGTRPAQRHRIENSNLAHHATDVR
ncbi:hypothetical protein Nepgr_001740 [Nepenthes gracilis]|uniref:MADS-box domain-containing protein n=1 Tax=Nepenthes gracilis TaxID=150966 RepID=A0AAD3RXQ2_NEPGR|nr:hypothetical protein Nepgr_001740 [Nepenthes gracilis]